MIGAPAIDPSAAERVFLGQVLLITADAFEGRALKGTVTKIAPEADPTTRTFLTQLTLVNPELDAGQRLLRPGMIVSVVVGAHLDQTAMLLPMTAIHQGRSAGELMVYEVVSESGRDIAKARKVSLGGVYNNQVEILPQGSDVCAGSRIAVTTSERLTDGTFVRLMPETTDSAMALPAHPEAQ
jgi:multidrug efflux pump subunit AcrA (membrane-fusion protein)